MFHYVAGKKKHKTCNRYQPRTIPFQRLEPKGWRPFPAKNNPCLEVFCPFPPFPTFFPGNLRELVRPNLVIRGIHLLQPGCSVPTITRGLQWHAVFSFLRRGAPWPKRSDVQRKQLGLLGGPGFREHDHKHSQFRGRVSRAGDESRHVPALRGFFGQQYECCHSRDVHRRRLG